MVSNSISSIWRVRAVLMVIVSCLAACDDASNSENTDTHTETDTATTPDTTETDATTTDADTSEPLPCTLQLTPEGGSQEACGLRLFLPPNAVAQAVTVTVTQPTLSATSPKDMAAESKVFRLEADDENLELQGYMTLHLPHDAGNNSVWMAKYFEEWGSWGVLETCLRASDTAGIRTTTLGTFTTLTDQGNNEAKGGGQFEVTWSTRTTTFPLGELGFAHYMPSASGARAVTLYGVNFETGQPETFRLDLTLSPDNTTPGGLASISYVNDLGEQQSFMNWEGITPPSPLNIIVSEPTPDHLEGSVAGTLFRDQNGTWEELLFSATFQADIVRHFVPSEDPCEIP